MSSSRWPSLALAAGILSLTLTAGAGALDDVRRAVEFGYSQQYDSAWHALGRVPACDSLAPLTGFWRAGLIQMLLYDSGDPALADSFYRASDRALAACRTRLAKRPRDAQAHMFYGLVQLNRANCQSWQRDRLKALFTLGSAANSLGRAAELDSTLADAWFGLGAIEYFRATADRYIGGMGIFGSSARAFQRMARARAGRGWLHAACGFTLAFMRKEDGDAAGAVATCREVLREWPGNRTGLKLLRESCITGGLYTEALAVARALDSSITRDFPRNRYGLAENRLAALKAWDGLGRRDSVLACADRLIGWSPYERETPWLADYVAEARQYRRKWEQ